MGALAYILLPVLLSTRQVPPSGRLRPLLVGIRSRSGSSGTWAEMGS
jgi:hypothetical protein